MRKLPVLLLSLFSISAMAQRNDIGWIAPEGKIINYRTISWNDFLGKERESIAKENAAQNLQAEAYVIPAIYFIADSARIEDNGRVKFVFHTRCAFMSDAFVRESTKKAHTNYVLIHEQDHYDIALNYANKLQRQLSSRDYSSDKYNEEIDKIYDDLFEEYRKTQERYDHEVNPEGRDEVELQHLWDMRIRKCYENNTDEFYSSPENVVQGVKIPGATVKRIAGEKPRQFAVRARPLYTEFPEEMGSKVMETSEWSQDIPAIIAFYTQKYYMHEDGGDPKDLFRTFAYIFMPNGKDTYKRIMIDTFTDAGRQVKIKTAFFANADSDQAKELVILYTSEVKSGNTSGTMYSSRIYDNINPKLLPARLKKLDEVARKIESGIEGELNGAPSKAKYKTEEDIVGALGKLGISNTATPSTTPHKRIITQ